MKDSEWPSKKIVSIVDPVIEGQKWVANSGEYRALSTLTFSYRKGTQDLWQMEIDQNNIELVVGDQGFQEYRSAIEENLFDSGIGTEDAILMFW
jgi:hypothetical protein